MGLIRGGAGTALVGSHEVFDGIAALHDLGIDEFVFSGYPTWRRRTGAARE